MSKVAAKAGAKAAAKPAAKTAAAAPVPAAKAAAAAPVIASSKSAAPKLGSLEDMKKLVNKHELKIEDLEEDVKNEPNKKERTELQNKLSKLKTDEVYLKTLEGIKLKQKEEMIAAEKAQLVSSVEADKTESSVSKASEKGVSVDVKEAGRPRAASASTWLTIDAGFDGTGKDAAAAKTEAVSKLQVHAADTAFALRRLSKLVPLFSDGKLGATSIKAAAAIVSAIQPRGHGIATVVVPLLLAGMEDKKWKTKAGCLEVLLPCLLQMSEATPAQLAECLPVIVSKLAEAALEVRAEVRSATGAVLKQMGQLVQSPEITILSSDLVMALAEPTNQKQTQAVLARMGNQTFMSLLDPASLSLMMPILVRGLKEREPMSKKWSAQIFGSVIKLVPSAEVVLPYLTKVVPLLQEALFDPVAEVQREAAKAFGILEEALPDYSFINLQPWLCEKMRNGSQGEQNGAALGFAEVIFKMDKGRADKLTAALQLSCAVTEKWNLRRGFVELLDVMPLAMKMEFVPYIQRLFPAMLANINGDKDPVEDPGQRASLSLVQRFGDLCPELLLPSFEGTFAATLQSTTSANQIVREKTAGLLWKVVEKILEHKKFGQDFLTTEDCSTKETRLWALCLVFMMRHDPDAAVKRISNAAWKAAGGAPKVQKAIMPDIEKMLAKWRSGEMGTGAQKLAREVTDGLVKTGDIEVAPTTDLPQAATFVFPPTVEKTEDDAAKIVAGQKPSVDVGFESDAGEKNSCRDATAAEAFFNEHDSFKPFPDDVRHHCAIVAVSVAHEGIKRKRTGPTIAGLVAENVKDVLAAGGHDFAEQPIPSLPNAAEAAAKAILGDLFDALGAGEDSSDNEVLLRCDSLLLMYGAGHLLLKDTPLIMRMNERYGIVAHNGAGKTTLMKEIANHRIVGMPKDLKCVHVDDSKLGEMTQSCLTSLEYVIRMAKEIGVHDAGRETLLAVGFAANMLDEPVAELSTGWRMRLTLAVSMLKHADLVLLDEPTNHLDEESVDWLGEYILSIKQSSVMVISHEPKFLNKVCTHVIAYVDRKLEYTEGNFDAFAAKKGLDKDQLDKMLSGNLSFNTKKAGEDGEDGEADVTVSGPIAGPPKLSFPVPGSCEGVKSGSKSVLEAKNLSFRYAAGKDYLISDVNVKLSLNSRVAICGRNGCGKSTLMTILCSELSPSENKDETYGVVSRHCNVRLAYMKQDHLKALGPFFDTSPYVYMTTRFKDGYDGELQQRLIDPEDSAEAGRRAQLAKLHGKNGNEVAELLSRTKQGSNQVYEVQWVGCDDSKQNTLETAAKLQKMGLDKVCIACDERIAAKAAGLDQRPLTRREVTRHCEAFGIDEEMCCNRQVRGFSAGQKVRLSLSAMFWTKPHLIAVDEPTNYLDVETVEALAKALTNFRGGIVMIEPKTDFVERICNEKWVLEDANITMETIVGGGKRQA